MDHIQDLVYGSGNGRQRLLENVLGFLLLTIVLQPVEVLANANTSPFSLKKFVPIFRRKRCTGFLNGMVIFHFVIIENVVTNIINLTLPLT